MSTCLHDRWALTLYDPEGHREKVRFNRKSTESGKVEVVSHQRMAELCCARTEGYDNSFARFERLCAGSTEQIFKYEHSLFPSDEAVVLRNSDKARKEFEALAVEAAATLDAGTIERLRRHDPSSTWKTVALSIRDLTNKLDEDYERDEVTRAHLLALAKAHQARAA